MTSPRDRATADRVEADDMSVPHGDNLSRLMRVKASYDPEDVFHFSQSIPVAVSDQ